MPRKKIVTTREIIDADEPQAIITNQDAVPGAELDQAEALNEVLREFGHDEIKIKISKWTSSGSAYCFSTDKLDEEYIRDSFGGGKYSARIFVNGNYKQTIPLVIAEPINRTNPQIAPVPQIIERQSSDSGETKFLREMILAMIGNRQATPVGELTQAMRDLNMGGGGSDKLMEMFIKGMEMGRESGSGDDSWKGIIKDVAKEALPMLSGMAVSAKQIPGQVQQAQPGTQPNPQDQQAMMQAQLKQGIDYLKAKCLKNSDPELYVAMVVDNADVPMYQPLIHAILTTEFSVFTTIDPAIANPPFRAFFEYIYNGIRSAFAQDDSMGVDTGGEPGDSRDANKNAGSGANGVRKP